MRTLSVAAGLLILAFAVGCAGAIRMSTADAKALRGSRMQAVHYMPPAFMAMTPGRAAAGGAIGGVVGGIATVAMGQSAGKALVRGMLIDDPAAAVKARLARKLAESWGISGVAQIDAPRKTSMRDLDTLAAAAGGADVVLDVRTLGWGFVYFPFNWSHYRVRYAVEARLIRVSEKRIVARARVSYVEKYDDTSKAPLYDELLANNAVLLRAKLAAAAEHCAEKLLPALLPAK